ncbi:mitochondrial fission ELM1 family protein [bacterium]|nr:mitochondrial fission ELM1 family protein [bacterium]
MKALILSDGKPGHVNQSRALCSLLGFPAHEVRISFKSEFLEGLLRARINLFSKLPQNIPQMLGMMHSFVSEPSIKSLQAVLVNKPEIVVSAGSTTASANVLVSKAVRAKSVVMMRPSALPLDIFDLVVLPEHDRSSASSLNIVYTPVVLSYFDSARRESADEIIEEKFGKEALKSNPLAFIIGGISPYFQMHAEEIIEVTRSCWAWATKKSCGMMATTSRRTPLEVETALVREFSAKGYGNINFIWGRKDPFNPLPALLPRASAAVVTEDSISMISEAILQGHRPLVVTLVPRRRSRKLARFKGFLTKSDLAVWLKPEDIGEYLKLNADELIRSHSVDLGSIKHEIKRKLGLNENR